MVDAGSEGFDQLMRAVFGPTSDLASGPRQACPGSPSSCLWISEQIMPGWEANPFLPRELRSFLDHGRWLLIVRGGEGSGSLDLALAALELHSGPRTLLSSRFDGPTLAARFPRFARLTSSAEGVDVERVGDPVRLPSLEADPERRPVAPGAPPLVNRLPPRQEGTSRMVVVHGWNTLVDTSALALGRPGLVSSARLHLERVLLARLQESADRIMLLLEEGSSTALEGVADGDIRLGERLSDERRLRELGIGRLDGVSSPRPGYLFTLGRGTFEGLPPLPDRWPCPENSASPPVPLGPRSVWPGSLAYATTFGLLRGGEMSYFESDLDVPRGAQRLLAYPLLESTLRRGGKVLLVTDQFGAPARTVAVLQRRLSGATVERLFRMVSLDPSEAEVEPSSPCILPLRATLDVTTGPRFDAATGFLSSQGEAAVPAVVMMDINAFWLAAQRLGAVVDPRSLVGFLTRGLSERGVAELLWGPPEDRLAPELRRKAAVHMRLRQVHGSTVLYGVRPWSSAYHLVPSFACGPEVDPYMLLPAA